MSDKEKERYKVLARGKEQSGINIFLKKFFDNWGFGTQPFGEMRFGSNLRKYRKMREFR